MKGTIEKIWENKTKNGQKYQVVSIDGRKYSLWDAKASEGLAEGAAVEYKWRQSGNYRHITDIEPVPYEPNESNGLGLRDQRILKMSCLKSASAILASLDVPAEEKIDMTLSTARKFEKYITGPCCDYGQDEPE